MLSNSDAVCPVIQAARYWGQIDELMPTFAKLLAKMRLVKFPGVYGLMDQPMSVHLSAAQDLAGI